MMTLVVGAGSAWARPVSFESLARQGAGPAAAALVVEVGAEAVSVSGVTPGGQVAWWSVAHEPQPYHRRLVRRGGVETDADGNGTVELPVNGPVALRTVFAVVDLRSGEFTVASPEGFAPAPLEFAEDEGLTGSAPGQVSRLSAARESLVILYARPGAPGPASGAWILTVVDGAAEDDDAAEDGALAGVMSEAEAVGSSPPAPAYLQPGDVLFAIDSRSLAVHAERLAGGGAEGAP